MQNLSLNPILEGLTPIFKQLKSAAMYACLVFPVALNAQAKSLENNHIQIFSVQEIKRDVKDEQAFFQFADQAIELVKVTSALADFAISFAPFALEVISTQDLPFLEEKIKEYDSLIAGIFSDMAQCGIEYPLFVSELKTLSQKLHYFSNMMKSQNYKQQSDQVMASRLYQGKESVGYTFNQAHSFHDFKKAMMM